MKQLKAIHDLFRFEDDLFRNEAEIFRNEAEIFRNERCTGIGQNTATTRGRRARQRDSELESGKSGNVVFFARFNLVILAIRNSLGSYGS